MIELITVSQNWNEEAPDHVRFGGNPNVPRPSFVWPTCKECRGNMQYLGRLGSRHPTSGRTKHLLLFMCQNQPGLCEEWDANSGGNCVIAVDVEGLAPADVPSQGEVQREVEHGAKIVATEFDTYETARSEWPKTSGRDAGDILGVLGGEPSWIQGDETPSCDVCSTPMRFVAQLEEGPDRQTAMNFGGGGCAYVFECSACEHQAKMLWQC